MSILSRGSYEVLLELLPNFTGNYLEIGVYDGDMLKDFATRWPDKTFYGIDPFISCPDTTGHHGVPVGMCMESQRASARENFKGVANIIFFEVTSKLFNETMNQDTLDAMNVDVVYVDGNHSYSDTLNDLLLSERLIRGDGIIYIDDFDLPAVLNATERFIHVKGSRVFMHKEHMIVLKP